MINWILGLFNSVVGSINNVIKWILGIIAAVYSFIDHLFNQLAHDLSDVWNEAVGLFREVWSFATTIYNYVIAGIQRVWHDITTWVTGLWHDLTSAVDYLGRLIVKWVDYITHWVEQLWHDLETWVLNNIWNPLFKAITEAWNWITHEGYLVYYYLTHPDKLVALLGHWLWISWVDLLKRYGHTIGRWLAHVMFSMVSDFLTILEDFISGIL